MASTSRRSRLQKDNDIAHKYIDNSEKFLGYLLQNSESSISTHLSAENYPLVVQFYKDISPKLQRDGYTSLPPSFAMLFYLLSSIFVYSRVLSNKEYARDLYKNITPNIKNFCKENTRNCLRLIESTVITK